VSLLLCVFFVFIVVISFSLHAMLPLLANKDEYKITNINCNNGFPFLCNDLMLSCCMMILLI